MAEGKVAILKDGRAVRIRGYTPSDKEALVSMYAGLDQASLKWSMPPYDRQRIERWTSNLESAIILVATEKARIIGHLQISIATNSRFQGIGELFIYLRQDSQNLGLGRALLQEGISTARNRRLHRIELTVVADNHRGVHLYENMGFQREGVKRENYFGEDGKYHDEVIMGILL